MSSSTRTPVAEREITLVRTFDAPRELVFSMWTDAKHLAQWWGPLHFDNPVCEAEARAGGPILIHMRGPHGSAHVMAGAYLEITPHTRIVFTTSVDDNGVRLLEGYNVVTFEEAGGKTTMTLRAKVSGFAETAKIMVGGFEVGWAQSLEKLEALVASRRGNWRG
jgi:uncharacterized protein YndB with AHSA1/START domain